MRDLRSCGADPNSSQTLQTRCILGVKPRKFRAVQIQHTEQSRIFQQRHHDFGIGRRIAGDVAGELVHVGDDHCFALLRCRTADAFAERDADARRLALKRSEERRVGKECRL